MHALENMSSKDDKYPGSYASFQQRLAPTAKRFATESRSDVIWSNIQKSSVSLRTKHHLLDQRILKTTSNVQKGLGGQSGEDEFSPGRAASPMVDGIEIRELHTPLLDDDKKEKVDPVGKVKQFLAMGGLESVTESKEPIDRRAVSQKVGKRTMIDHSTRHGT